MHSPRPSDGTKVQEKKEKGDGSEVLVVTRARPHFQLECSQVNLQYVTSLYNHVPMLIYVVQLWGPPMVLQIGSVESYISYAITALEINMRDTVIFIRSLIPNNFCLS